VLVHELALRDDLEYEKELKNQFIWLLLTVQKRRREAATQIDTNNHRKMHNDGGVKGNGNEVCTSFVLLINLPRFV